MQLEQLQYLVEIERTGSISTAAKNLHVSQSAVSKSLSRLEKHLGLQLFVRQRTGLEPTEAGERLIQKASEILGLIQEFHAMAAECGNVRNHNITIACIPMLTQIVSASLEELSFIHSDLRATLDEKNSRDSLADVRNHTVDIGFMVVNQDLIEDPQLNYTILLETDIYVCVNASSPLATRKSLRPEDLRSQTVVSYNGTIMDWFDTYFQSGDPLRYSFVTTNLESIKRNIARGTALSILSALSIELHGFLENNEIVAIPLITRDQIISMQIAAVTSNHTPVSRLTKQLLSVVKSRIENLESIRKASHSGWEVVPARLQ